MRYTGDPIDSRIEAYLQAQWDDECDRERMESMMIEKRIIITPRLIDNLTIEQMMVTATQRFNSRFERFDVDGEMHYEAFYQKVLGPMVETELYWFLKGFLAAKDVL